ncbi:MAG TPA: glycosyltransferase [Candidatus Brocadiia bacterium]|nr:glycosyltransferase [Candidatus Brocadiia bacterium]
MRILYVITELDEGGAEQSLCRLVLGLDRAEFEPQVAYMAGSAPLAAELNARSVKTIGLRMGEVVPGGEKPGIIKRAGEFREAGRVLSDAVQRFQPDIVHAYLFHASLLARSALKNEKGPLMLTSVRVAEPRMSHRALDKLTKGWNYHWVCVSEGVRRSVVGNGIPQEKASVIPNGVDARRFTRGAAPGGVPEDDEFLAGLIGAGAVAARQRERARFGVRPDAALMAAVGRLHEQKGFDVLIRAFAKGGFADFGHRLVIAGEGPLRAELEKLAAQLGIAASVAMPGRLEDVRPLMLASDVFISSSRWEGMCNAVMEAMAMELPVVATDVAGSEELILNGKTGLLVPAEDAEAITKAVAGVLADGKFASALGMAARRHMEDNFTLDRMVRRHEELYRNLLSYSQRQG